MGTARIKAARTSSALVAIWGVAFGLMFLYAPIHRGCSVSASGEVRPGPPGASPVVVTSTSSEVCEWSSLVSQQEIWPAPFLWVALWSLAPTLAAIGTWSAPRPRMWLVYLALLLALTAMISFGAGLYFLVFVVLPLAVVTSLAQRASAARPGAPSVDAQAGGGG